MSNQDDTTDDVTTDGDQINLPGIGIVTDWASQYRSNFELLGQIFRGEKTVPAFSTESTDSETYTSAYAGSIQAPIMGLDPDAGDVVGGRNSVRNPMSQVYHLDSGWVGETVFCDGRSIYQWNGRRAEFVETAPTGFTGTVRSLARSPKDRWLVIASGSAPYTAYWYESLDDLDGHDELGTMSDVHRPLSGSIFFFDDPNVDDSEVAIWAEYTSDGSVDTRIIRAYAEDTDDDGDLDDVTFDVVHTATDVRHHHNVDPDLYNEGEFYATTGDANSEVKWFKSTDYGATWSEISGAGGDQRWRTVRCHFTEDHVWWGTDGIHDGAVRLYRADRGSISSPEEMAVLSDDLYVLGLIHSRPPAPHGFLIFLRDPDGTVDEVPVQFYSIETETLREVTTLPADGPASSFGARDAVAHLDQGGMAFAQMDNIESWFDGSTWAFGLEMSELM